MYPGKYISTTSPSSNLSSEHTITSIPKRIQAQLHTEKSTNNSLAMAVIDRIHVSPIVPPKGSSIDFGAELSGADLENITEYDFQVIQQALYEYQVVIFKSQQNLSPKAQYELTRLFDPTVQAYGHGKTLDQKKSVLHPDLKTIPHQPQVQVIGNGPVAEFEGLKNITLKHPHHKLFHKEPVSAEDDRDVTRFYR